jgi:hemerythrin
MSVKFIWDKSYSVGCEALDNQHKKMFEIANSLDEGLDNKRIKRIIMDLYKYTREHFSTEEAEMKKMGFPKYDEHIFLHNDLISKLNTTTLQKFDNEEAVRVLKKFLYDWILDHILNHDAEYFKFANTQKKQLLNS